MQKNIENISFRGVTFCGGFRAVTKATGDGYPLPELRVAGEVDVDFGGLYRKARRERIPVTLRFRPYYSFANREECDMLVRVRGE